MRVFVTGATGFIGSAVVQQLLQSGHEVTGLARSDEAAKTLTAAGARVHRGSIEDLDSIRKGAAAADAAVHTAFYHAFTHAGLGTRFRVIFGGAPSGIVMRFLKAAVDTDRSVIETLGTALGGSAPSLVAVFGTMSLTAGRLGTEKDSFDPNSVGGVRGYSEKALTALAARGVRTAVIRLPPTVHGAGDHGFIPQVIQTARKKCSVAYVGDGLNRWPAVHRSDAASLIRMALENASAGAVYHAVAEEGIQFREIANVIGRELEVPVVSKSPKEASALYSFLAPFIQTDNPVSSAITQAELHWNPTGPTLLSDLKNADYFAT